LPVRKQVDDDLVSIQDAARLSGIPISRLRRLVKEKRVATRGRGTRGRNLYSWRAISEITRPGAAAVVYASDKGTPRLPEDAPESVRTLASLPYLARMLVGADYGAITVLGETGVIEHMFVSGITPDKVAQMGPPPSGRGVLGLMGTETSALRVDRISGHPRSVGFPAGHPTMEALLGVAVQRNGVHLANLYLTRGPGHGPFTVEDQQLVETASQHVAAALEHARLHERERRLRSEAEQLRAVAEDGRRRLEAFAAAAPAGVIVTDADTDRIVLVNEEVGRLFGMPVKAGITRSSLHKYFTYRRPDGTKIDPDQLPLYRAIRDKEIVRSEEVVFERKGGGRMPLLLHAAPVNDASGKVVAGVVIFQDISRLKELDEAKADFLSMITHDLRSPLTTIKGLSTEAFGRHGRGENVQELVEAIDEEVDQMAELVNNLLDMSRIEAGSYPLEREECHLLDICGDATRRVRRAAQWRDRTIRLRVPATLPSMYADPGQIGRVVDNFLSNALKYSDGPIDLTARAPGGGAEIRVEIKDRGIGIPPGEIARLFDKFFRITSSGRKGRGAGLGLAICKAIVTAHGGQVGVRSAPGKGSVFWFTVPTHS